MPYAAFTLRRETMTATVPVINIDEQEETSGACCSPFVVAPVITDVEANEYAGWFKALADPTRIQILNLLAQSEDPICVCEITPRFQIGQPTISHHLKILRDARFVH